VDPAWRGGRVVGWLEGPRVVLTVGSPISSPRHTRHQGRTMQARHREVLAGLGYDADTSRSSTPRRSSSKRPGENRPSTSPEEADESHDTGRRTPTVGGLAPRGSRPAIARSAAPAAILARGPEALGHVTADAIPVMGTTSTFHARTSTGVVSFYNVRSDRRGAPHTRVCRAAACQAAAPSDGGAPAGPVRRVSGGGTSRDGSLTPSRYLPGKTARWGPQHRWTVGAWTGRRESPVCHSRRQRS